MEKRLKTDLAQMDAILERAKAMAVDFLTDIDQRPVSIPHYAFEPPELSDDGLGGLGALDYLEKQISPLMSAITGPRYFGLIMGGATPASLAADWMTSTFDQNVVKTGASAAPLIEVATIDLVKDLLDLDVGFQGSMVSGSSMANFCNLVTARQHLLAEKGWDIAEMGANGAPELVVLSATAHSTILKALATSGIGRAQFIPVGTEEGSEVVDLKALGAALEQHKDKAIIVVANAGTVNTGAFDPLSAIADLKSKYHFWMHVDGAFGAVTAASSRYRHLMRGINRADSLSVDFHKWMNVPYDSALQLTRHLDSQMAVFGNRASYVPQGNSTADNFLHITPEMSRRFRALPVLINLLAYGRNGLADIVERNCAIAAKMASDIHALDGFELLADVKTNMIAVALRVEGRDATADEVKAFLDCLAEGGKAFATPTVLWGRAAVHMAISNWRTEDKDIQIVVAAFAAAYHKAFQS